MLRHAAVLLGVVTLACGSDGSSGGTGGAGSSSDAFAAAREDCVAAINAHRATEGKPAYARWTDAEACVDGSVKADSAHAGTAHWSFTNGQACGASAQNTCPGWPSLDSISTSCLDMMWDEGPGEPFSEHGHYINMSSGRYTKVACGFYVAPSGEVWASQNFK
jgi:hypothetical protein